MLIGLSTSRGRGKEKHNRDVENSDSGRGEIHDTLFTEVVKVPRISVSSFSSQLLPSHAFLPSCSNNNNNNNAVCDDDVCVTLCEKQALLYERLLSERQALLNVQKEASEVLLNVHKEASAVLLNVYKESSVVSLNAHKEASAVSLNAYKESSAVSLNAYKETSAVQKEASEVLLNAYKDSSAVLLNAVRTEKDAIIKCQTEHNGLITSLLQDSIRSGQMTLDKVLDFSLKSQTIQAQCRSGGGGGSLELSKEQKRIALQSRIDRAMKELKQATLNVNKAREDNDQWAIELHETYCNELKQMITEWMKEKLSLL
jgi:hypothetical protein